MQEMRVECPRCPAFAVWATIDGPVSKDTVGLLREIVLAIHVRDYHPFTAPARAADEVIAVLLSWRGR